MWLLPANIGTAALGHALQSTHKTKTVTQCIAIVSPCHAAACPSSLPLNQRAKETNILQTPKLSQHYWVHNCCGAWCQHLASTVLAPNLLPLLLQSQTVLVCLWAQSLLPVCCHNARLLEHIHRPPITCPQQPWSAAQHQCALRLLHHTGIAGWSTILQQQWRWKKEGHGVMLNMVWKRIFPHRNTNWHMT